MGDTPVKFQAVCPQNGTAVLRGLTIAEELPKEACLIVFVLPDIFDVLVDLMHRPWGWLVSGVERKKPFSDLEKTFLGPINTTVYPRCKYVPGIELPFLLKNSVKAVRVLRDSGRVPQAKTLRSMITLLEPQSRFGDRPVKFQVVCPQNGTAVLKGVKAHPPLS